MKAKIDAAKALEIKRLLAENTLTQSMIATQFGISRSLVSDIGTGRAWKHVGGPSSLVKKHGGQRARVPDYDPTDARVLALEAEVAHLLDERSYVKKQLKAASKQHGLFTAMADELERVVVPMKPLPRAISLKGKNSIEEHLVMHLSDGHHDTVVVPADCGGLERHNFPISMRRAEEYVDTVLKWTQQTLAPQFKFPELTILAYGDHTSGEIHGHAQRSYFRNVFKNCFAIGQLHALMYRDLAPYFKHINVVYVPGNHGRRSLKKDYHGAHDNWDYMIAEVARLHCADIQNVQFTIPESFSINLDINGIGFCIFHGDDIRSSMGIPWYGLERRQHRIMAINQVQTGPPVRYYCCGHFHRAGSIAAVNGEMIMNGAWVATDAYAYNALGGFTEPTQLLHGVNSKYGITWKLPVKLRSGGEEKGPKRYKIELMDEVAI